MDWNRLWHEEKNTTKERHSSDYWDSFAPKYRKHPGKSTYEADFLALADIRPGETVFDMGCASGTLALLRRQVTGYLRRIFQKACWNF